MFLSRREFLGQAASFLMGTIVGEGPHIQEVRRVVSQLSPIESRLIPDEGLIINPVSGQAAWLYRGELYLLRYTYRPHPNSSYECDISSAGKVPGCARTERGFEMGPEWRTLQEVTLSNAGFNLDTFIKKNTPIDWSKSRNVPPESVIVNRKSGKVAWLYRGELYYVKLTHRDTPNSQLECDIASAGEVCDCRKNPKGRGYQMSSEWQTLDEIQRSCPNFDVVTFLSK